MPNSSIAVSYEFQMMRTCPVINKLKRIGILTDAVAAAPTTGGVAQLISGIYAALRQAQGYDIKPTEATMLVRVLEQQLNVAKKLGVITDALVNALTTVNTVQAATDLRYLIALPITQTGFDPASEQYPNMKGHYAYAVTR